MNTILKGGEISKWYATSIGIGTSKNVNGQGANQKFLVIKYMADDGGDPATAFKWGDDFGAQIDQLLNEWQFCRPDPNHENGYLVDMDKLEAKVATLGPRQKIVWDNILVATGGTMEWYPFKKGECYANDATGKRTKYKDGTDVKAEGIYVFCEISRQEADEQGHVRTIYKKGKSPNEIGEGIERRLWKEAVTPTVVPLAQPTQPAPEQPATVAPAAPAPAVQPATVPGF